MRIIREPISRDKLRAIAKERFGNLVKAVVGVEQRIIALGGELYSDAEVVLAEQEGSQREHTWGINLYVEKDGEEFIEFDSVINLKPSFGNRSRGVGDPEIRTKIIGIVSALVKK
ncbi:MAG: hypothetical protein A3D64_01670 [Candidatus Wildermuthbacteria bacterium RIFCSPHIGHO2_02_FULL_49_9]|uniref:Uncharacterized protein n=2 Tax=Candidatus Wildermuthiibacteriota TaxID=1817923 RepID=A0A1G2QYK5_9BACT|nr:MAG: hypothetical protein A2672_02410 [Candidatus Wildermuthbacteria bacterium RIFCSPHIGHO2_01_FULL_49_22b]OHA70560.1 MAG: hypothetical protein A3D64_01670 [Candidatus Wildermuthbacteria bacterium RIFCSPHIGHO2_02_FULL_49_9]